MIPVLRPLKDPTVATVWSGLAASTIGEDLFRDREDSFVCLLELVSDHHITQVKDLLPYIKRCESIKLLSDRIRSLGCSNTPATSSHTLILRTSENDDVGAIVAVRICMDQGRHPGVIGIIVR